MQGLGKSRSPRSRYSFVTHFVAARGDIPPARAKINRSRPGCGRAPPPGVSATRFPARRRDHHLVFQKTCPFSDRPRTRALTGPPLGHDSDPAAPLKHRELDLVESLETLQLPGHGENVIFRDASLPHSVV
jgi:hypothetical protein